MMSDAEARGGCGVLAFLLAGLLGSPGAALAGDHGDTPLLIGAGRHDARITDLFAFTRDENLVLILCVNPAIPPSVTDYRFPSDVEYKLMIDSHSEVSFDDPISTATYGGTVLEPAKVDTDAEIHVRFNPQGKMLVENRFMRGSSQGLTVFAGLRDDPFIRGPRTGRNVAAIVVEFPLEYVLNEQSTLLIWATSTVRNFNGPIQEHTGRALRSQFPENDLMNSLTPAGQSLLFDGIPDVMIYDTSLPASFPNGRLLTDDVVDLVGDARVLGSDAPFPEMNDVPFPDDFPYLAPPQLP